jgi:hypothetical protein
LESHTKKTRQRQNPIRKGFNFWKRRKGQTSTANYLDAQIWRFGNHVKERPESIEHTHGSELFSKRLQGKHRHAKSVKGFRIMYLEARVQNTIKNYRVDFEETDIQIL